MSILKVNTIQSYTAASPVTINDSLTVTGSLSRIKLDLLSLPTSSAGVTTGELYRTGSNLDEIRIAI